MMVPPIELFYSSVGEEIKVDRGQHERRILATPAVLFFHAAHPRPQKMAELLRHVVKGLRKVLVLEFDDVDVNQQQVLRIRRYKRPYLGGNPCQIVLGQGVFERGAKTPAPGLGPRSVATDQAGKDRFFAGIVGVDRSGGNARLLGNVADVGPVKSLLGEQF